MHHLLAHGSAGGLGLFVQLQGALRCQQAGSCSRYGKKMLQATGRAQLLGELPTVLLTLLTQALVLCHTVLLDVCLEVLPPLYLCGQGSSLRLPGLLVLLDGCLQVGHCRFLS